MKNLVSWWLWRLMCSTKSRVIWHLKHLPSSNSKRRHNFLDIRHCWLCTKAQYRSSSGKHWSAGVGNTAAAQSRVSHRAQFCAMQRRREKNWKFIESFVYSPASCNSSSPMVNSTSINNRTLFSNENKKESAKTHFLTRFELISEFEWFVFFSLSHSLFFAHFISSDTVKVSRCIK